MSALELVKSVLQGSDGIVDVTDSPTNVTALRGVLLHTEAGPVFFLHKNSDLVDLEQISLAKGETVVALNAEDVMRHLFKFNLAKTPAIPNLIQCPVWVDSSVKAIERPALWVSNRLIEVPRTLLKTALSDASFLIGCIRAEEALDLVDVEEVRVQNQLTNFTKIRIKRTLSQTLEVPPLSGTAREIIAIRNDENANLGRLVKCVEMDPSIAAMVLRIANSAAYAQVRKITSLEEAVGRVLGFETVLNLTLGIALSNQFHIPRDKHHVVVDYWLKAVWRAEAAKRLTGLVKRDRKLDSGLAYTAGLLHNYGLLILAHAFPAYYDLLETSWNANDHMGTEVIERKILGITREEIAATLFQHWELPDQIVQSTLQLKNKEPVGEFADYIHLLQAAGDLIEQSGMPCDLNRLSYNPYHRLGVTYKDAQTAFNRLLDKQMDVDGMASMLA